MLASLIVSDLLLRAESLGRTDLRGRPVVIGGRPSHRGAVAAASPEARARGVEPGMPLAAAARLCPDAVFLPGDLGRARDLAAAVQACVARQASDVVWVTPVQALLPAGRRSCAELHAAIERARVDVHERLGVRVACGLATNRLVADVAARVVQPSGLLHVLPGYERRVLAPLSLGWLDGVDGRLRARLSEAGVHTFRDLADLPDDALWRLAGRAGPVLRRLARGEDPRPLPVAQPLRRLSTWFEVSAHDHDPRAAGLRPEAAAVIGRALGGLLSAPGLEISRVSDVLVRLVDDAGGRGDTSITVPLRGAGPTSASRVAGAVVERLAGVTGPCIRGFLTVLLVPPPVACGSASRSGAAVPPGTVEPPPLTTARTAAETSRPGAAGRQPA